MLAGGAAAAAIRPWLVFVLLGGGLAELVIRRQQAAGIRSAAKLPLLAVRAVRAAGPARTLGSTAGAGVLLPVAWTAFKVGALSFGGGFVIIPLMQADAVGHHWMTSGQFLNGVALGQTTPGPVVQTVATVGYAAAGLGDGLLAAVVAFSPSFAFVLGGSRHFRTLRGNHAAQAFLDGAGPAAIGAILGSAVPLARRPAGPVRPGWPSDALGRLAEATSVGQTDWGPGIYARCRALLSDGADADGWYREAIDRLSRTGIRVELARAHLLYGEWLRREGRLSGAREQLRTAHDMLTAIGMQAFAGRARRELLAAGERVRTRTADSNDELTPQEAQIARFALSGLSNPEMGAQLFLSARTVEWHLSKVFAKLGISSRRQLHIALGQPA